MENQLFTFSKLSIILLDKTNYKHDLKRVPYYKTIFKNIDPITHSESEINKYIKGNREIPDFGDTEIFSERLKENVEILIQDHFKYMDFPAIKKRIQETIDTDPVLSKEKREEFFRMYVEKNFVDYLYECFLFAINRKEAKKGKSNIDLSQYLTSRSVPEKCAFFQGRKEELKEIDELIQKSRRLALTGIEGIGKTELAKEYGKKQNKHYANIVFLQFHNSLKQTIADLHFQTDKPEMMDDKKFDHHFACLKMLGEYDLIILDNFNILPENEELWKEFFELRTNILITTHIELPESIPKMQVNKLENSELLSIFYKFDCKAKADEKSVKEILKLVCYHTLTVELVAKTCKNARITPEKILQELTEKGVMISNSTEIQTFKDAMPTNATLTDHIRKLFELQNLSAEDLQTLRNMVLMPNTGISVELFYAWSGAENYNSINRLIRLGWIRENDNYDKIYLHPFLRKFLCVETEPRFSVCSNIITSISDICYYYLEDVEYYEDLFKVIKNIRNYAKIDQEYEMTNFATMTMTYLSKYLRYDMIEETLQWVSELPFFETNIRLQGVYYYVYGNMEKFRKNYENALIKYEIAEQILILSPIDHTDLISHIYIERAEILVDSDCKKALQCLATADKLREHEKNLYLEISLQLQMCRIYQRCQKSAWVYKNVSDLIQQAEKKLGASISLAKLYTEVGDIIKEEQPHKALLHYMCSQNILMDLMEEKSWMKNTFLLDELEKIEGKINELSKQSESITYICNIFTRLDDDPTQIELIQKELTDILTLKNPTFFNEIYDELYEWGVSKELSFEKVFLVPIYHYVLGMITLLTKSEKSGVVIHLQEALFGFQCWGAEYQCIIEHIQKLLDKKELKQYWEYIFGESVTL